MSASMSRHSKKLTRRRPTIASCVAKLPPRRTRTITVLGGLAEIIIAPHASEECVRAVLAVAERYGADVVTTEALKR